MTDTTVIPEVLRTLAEMALSEARRELEQRGNIDVMILLRHPDGHIENAKLGDGMSAIMNSGEAKSILFRFTRKYVEAHKITAVLFCTDQDVGVPTEKQKQMVIEDREGFRRLLNSLSLDQAVARGLVKRREALSITVQTADHVLILNQFYRRGQRTISWEERDQQLLPQEHFDGRQKMYGKEYQEPEA